MGDFNANNDLRDFIVGAESMCNKFEVEITQSTFGSPNDPHTQTRADKSSEDKSMVSSSLLASTECTFHNRFLSDHLLIVLRDI